MTSETKLLNAEDVAEILQISLSFDYALMNRGEIPTVRLGRAVRVRPQDLDEFIESSVQGAQPNIPLGQIGS
jgi:excisionase family DNA binding protein